MDFDSEIAVDKFVYYFYSIETLRYLDSGSAQSQITITDLSNAYIPLVRFRISVLILVSRESWKIPCI
jgi:restriction endonuclease S subunit